MLWFGQKHCWEENNWSSLHLLGNKIDTNNGSRIQLKDLKRKGINKLKSESKRSKLIKIKAEIIKMKHKPPDWETVGLTV